MSNQKEFKPTEGEWKSTFNSKKERAVRAPSHFIAFLPSPSRYQGQDKRYEEELEEVKFNAQLIAEAGTVYNRTGKTPKQLEQQSIEARVKWFNDTTALLDLILQRQQQHNGSIEALEVVKSIMEGNHKFESAADATEKIRKVIEKALSGQTNRNKELEEENGKLKQRIELAYKAAHRNHGIDEESIQEYWDSYRAANGLKALNQIES